MGPQLHHPRRTSGSLVLAAVLLVGGLVVEIVASGRAEVGAAGFPRGMVSLTFDDGWRSQYGVARPELNRRNLKGTFYSGSNAVRDGNWVCCMSATELRQLAADGHEIGSHTASHPDLTQLSDDQRALELKDSKGVLEQALGRRAVRGVQHRRVGCDPPGVRIAPHSG
jgi:peptidoglycan/xylan/chitin deacetylase (PgdA/CDA1 family)